MSYHIIILLEKKCFCSIWLITALVAEYSRNLLVICIDWAQPFGSLRRQYVPVDVGGERVSDLIYVKAIDGLN